MGLASHRVRVEAAGGTLTVTSAQPSGTIARIEVPVGTAVGQPGALAT